MYWLLLEQPGGITEMLLGISLEPSKIMCTALLAQDFGAYILFVVHIPMSVRPNFVPTVLLACL
jgi:hypothetical protein